MNLATSEEQVATYLVQSFPAAELTMTGEGDKAVYEIVLHGKVLIRLDHIGAEFFFPTRRRRKMSWSGIKEGTTKTIADVFLRDLANASYTVFSSSGLRIQKSRVIVSKFTCCPQCNEIGHIRVIIFQTNAHELDTEKFVSGGRGSGTNDPEIKCINCGWEGFPEDVRFTLKVRETREQT